MIRTILPTAVRVEERTSDLPHARLYPSEEQVVARAVVTRQQEYATGRTCARIALARLGIAPRELPRGRLGAPRWPSGIVGSITHCAGYRGAAVARATTVRTLGIDAEPNLPMPLGSLNGVASPSELVHVDRLAAEAAPTSDAVNWDRLLFSAKESVYKAWFPLGQRLLQFTDAEVRLSPDGTFTAQLRIAQPGAVSGSNGARSPNYRGRWLARNGLLVTTVYELAEDAEYAPGSVGTPAARGTVS